jgi:3-oxoisoapionate decarboxylase
MRLGIDSYSLRWQGWDAFQFLEYSANLGLDNVHFSERANFASIEEGYLKSLKRRADELGLVIEVGMGSFDKYATSFRPQFGSGEEQLTAMLNAARIVGSPVVRCFLGTQSERMGTMPIDQHIDEAIRTLKAVAPLARNYGIKFAVENHGGIDLLARELEYLVQSAGSDVVGVCLDTGNPAYAGEDPLLGAEILAKYATSSHVRDTRVWETKDGAMAQWVPLGDGNTDLRGIISILKTQAPTIPVDLEIITSIAPKEIPYNRPDGGFWEMYPNMLARDFVRFVALAKTGKPEPLEQLALPPAGRGLPEGELGERFKRQQREHFEQSVHYARDVLGLGERGRAA